MIGLSWASAGGEASAVFNEKYLAADGIENVVRVLEEIDNGSFPELEFVELNACPGGCVGGVMTVVNPYIAKARLQNLRRYLPVSQNHAGEGDGIPKELEENFENVYAPPTIGKDRADALRIMRESEELKKQLPGIDCGSCGLPTCAAFARDVASGSAKIEECIVFMREELQKLHGSEGGDEK